MSTVPNKTVQYDEGNKTKIDIFGTDLPSGEFYFVVLSFFKFLNFARMLCVYYLQGNLTNKTIHTIFILSKVT